MNSITTKDESSHFHVPKKASLMIAKVWAMCLAIIFGAAAFIGNVWRRMYIPINRSNLLLPALQVDRLT